MYQYKVEYRTADGQSKFTDITANSHRHAAFRFARQTGMLVLSTEFIA